MAARVEVDRVEADRVEADRTARIVEAQLCRQTPNGVVNAVVMNIDYSVRCVHGVPWH